MLNILLPSQIISRFGFSWFIYFATHLHIYCSIAKSMYLEKPKRLIILDGGNIVLGYLPSFLYICFASFQYCFAILYQE